MRVRHLIATLLAAGALAGCATNPVTGRKAVNLRTSLGPFTTGEVLCYVKWKVEAARAH